MSEFEGHTPGPWRALWDEEPEAEELPLAEALDLCVGAYGGAQFRKLMGALEKARETHA